jgi:hypothetical protein
MKHILLILAVVMSQSVLAADKKPLITNPIVEKAIRKPSAAHHPNSVERWQVWDNFLLPNSGRGRKITVDLC